jgi:chromosome segregation ATPase
MNDLDQVNVELPYDLAMGDEAARLEFYKSAQAILKSRLQVGEDHKNLWFRTLGVETERDQLKNQAIELRAALSLPAEADHDQCVAAIYGLFRSIGKTVVQSAGQDLEVREIIAQLKAEVERLRTAEGDAMTYKAGMENVAQQRDQLKTELEKVKADRKACWEEFKVQGRQLDRIKAENEALQKLAVELRGAAKCYNLHHCKAEQHAISEPCKVLARIDAAMTK